MRIVVTGGAGYIGSKLVPMLVQRGHLVRVFDEMLYGQSGVPKHTEKAGKIQVIQGTLEKLPSDLVVGMDAVIHLAGYSNDPTAEFSPERTAEVNVEGTHNLVLACEAAGVERFVLASSASLYDRKEGSTEVLDETADVDPQSTYSWTKLMCEQMLRSSKIPVTVALRKGTVFGYAPRMRWDLVVNTMVRDAILTGELTTIAGGQMWRPLVHVEDVAKAYVWAVESHLLLVHGQIFNVVQDNYQICDVAQAVTDCLISVTRANLPAAGKIRDYRISGAKLTKVGFTPSRTLAHGVAEVVEVASSMPEKALADPHGENISWLKVVDEVAGLLAAGVRP